MLSCGIPELSDLEDLKYVYDALRPHESETDATMYFTRLENRKYLGAAFPSVVRPGLSNLQPKGQDQLDEYIK